MAGPATTAVAADGPLASSIAVAWQRTAIRTIYLEQTPVVAPPAGGLYLAFTSMAVHDAAVDAQRQGTHAAAAAVATAAHHVLRHYFPTSGTALDRDLAASLAKVPNGKKETSGTQIGAAAAAAMIASRVGDGRNNASIVYAKAPALGIWQPAPGGAMALPWLGFVKPVVDIDPVVLDGPDPITSAAFAQDHEEVRMLGWTVDDQPDQGADGHRAVLLGQPGPVYRDAVCTLLENEPMGLLPTTRFFARVDAAMAMSFIEAWRLKYERRLLATLPGHSRRRCRRQPRDSAAPDPTWAPLVTNPAYADYPSGHAQATSAFAQVLRKTLGDDTALVLRVGWHQSFLRHAHRARARRVPRPHLGRPALPGRHGRRLLPRPHDGRPGDEGGPLTTRYSSRSRSQATPGRRSSSSSTRSGNQLGDPAQAKYAQNTHATIAAVPRATSALTHHGLDRSHRSQSRSLALPQ